MKRLTFFIFLFLFASNLISQDNNSKFSVGFQIQPGLDNMIFKSKYPNLTMPSSNKFGLDFGALLNYSINDKFSIGSGIKYINRGYTNSITVSNLNLSNINDPVLNGLKKIVIKFNLNYISIPFRLSYLAISIDKVNISPKIGCGLNYLFNLNTYSIATFNTKTETSRINDPITSNFYRFSVSGFCGIDFSYQLNNKIDLLFTPNFDLTLSPLQKGDLSQVMFKSYYWNLGFSVGIRKYL